MANSEAEGYKNKGNEAYKAGNYDEAIKQYNKAITLDPTTATYYSNRAAVHASKGDNNSALADANKCLGCDAAFVKGYSRKGQALLNLGKLDEAEAAYKEGLAVDSTNQTCSQGLQSVARARRPSWGGGAGGGGIGSLVAKLGEKLKKGGRMQMYMMFLLAYFMFNQVTGRGKGKTSPSPGPEGDDATSWDEGFPHRSFKEVDGAWLSLLQSEAKTDTLLLLLHQTSASAEADYGSALTRLAAVPSAIPQGVRLLAPDRPCHGYSPCQPNAEDWGWLDSLVDSRPVSQRLVVVSMGRDAARKALALAKQKPKETHLMLLNPSAEPPPLPGNLTSAADIRKWLANHGSQASAPALVDALRWATAGAYDPAQKAELEVGAVKGSKAAVLYGPNEEELEALHRSLEEKGARVTLRRDVDDMPGVLVEELQRVLAGGDETMESDAPESTEEEQEAED